MPPKIPHALRKLMDFNGVGRKDAAPSVVEKLTADKAGLFSSRDVRAVRVKPEQTDQKVSSTAKTEGGKGLKTSKNKKKRKHNGDSHEARHKMINRRPESDTQNMIPEVTSSLHRPATAIAEKNNLGSKKALPMLSSTGSSIGVSAMCNNKEQASAGHVQEISKPTEVFSSKKVKAIVFSEFNSRWKKDNKDYHIHFWPVSIYHIICPNLQGECTLYDLVKLRDVVDMMGRNGLIPQVDLQCLFFLKFLCTKNRRTMYLLHDCISRLYKYFPVCKNEVTWFPNIELLFLSLKGCASGDTLEVEKSVLLLKLLVDQITVELNVGISASSKTNKNAFSVSLDNGQSMLYKVGDFVDVARRMKPGENKPGGRAKVIHVNHSKGTVDVKYIMESKREKDIHPKFLSLHEEGRRTSRFAKLKAKESLAKSSRHNKTKDGGTFKATEYVSILDSWFGRNATNNSATETFQHVIKLILNAWNVREKHSGRAPLTSKYSQSCLTIITLLNILIARYPHIVEIIQKLKCNILSPQSVARKSLDVGLVTDDGNLYKQNYYGW